MGGGYFYLGQTVIKSVRWVKTALYFIYKNCLVVVVPPLSPEGCRCRTLVDIGCRHCVLSQRAFPA